jgi:hypothetical protein
MALPAGQTAPQGPHTLIVRGANAGSARSPATNGNSVMPAMIMGGAHKLGSPNAPIISTPNK